LTPQTPAYISVSATRDFATRREEGMTQRSRRTPLVWTGTLSRRSVLRGAIGLACAKLGAAAALAAPLSSEAKLPQEQVSYQPSPKGDRKCSGCFNYEGNGNCRVVAGPISPDGWCRLWNAR
jgi:hypothetical protein